MQSVGDLKLEFRDGAGGSLSPAERAAHPPRPAQGRRFELHSQQADVLNNVARDQHNDYQLRIGPMRRRARNVMRTGFALLFAGFAVFAVGGAMFAKTITHGMESSSAAPPNMTGWLIAGAGSLTLTLGTLVIIASLFMKRGVRREEGRW